MFGFALFDRIGPSSASVDEQRHDDIVEDSSLGLSEDLHLRDIIIEMALVWAGERAKRLVLGESFRLTLVGPSQELEQISLESIEDGIRMYANLYNLMFVDVCRNEEGKPSIELQRV